MFNTKSRVLFSVGIAFISLAIGIVVGWFLWGKEFPILSPLSSKQPEGNIDLPLQQYAFDKLQDNTFSPSTIELQKVLQTTTDFVSHLFTYSSEGKIISGMAHIPTGKGKFPVVIMIRGYVEREVYQTGAGTVRAAEVFAQNGFITLAPDFLGFGDSDPESDDGLLSRFNRPVQVLDLIASVESIEQADREHIFLWGHSNGGQIALSMLEISRKNYPTTLWAPVSKPFPYSILYYTDESPDRGKYLRGLIADFEKNYNVDRFSISVFYNAIKAPIQIHQGELDDAVPVQWSDALVEALQKLDQDVTYFTYPTADHNMVGSWNTVVRRDIEFFNKHLQ